MTPSPALAHLAFVAASSKSSSSPLLTLLPLLAIGVLGYFFFIRPQQRKAQAARQAKGSDIEVGDEVQSIGGIVGTVLEIHGDRYTIITGALGDDGNLDGPQPTRIVLVRQAIARKIEPIEDIRPADAPVDDAPVEDIRPATKEHSANGTGDERHADIDDVGGDATSTGEHGAEAEEA
jgi:preprotein translocase subunit YajC